MADRVRLLGYVADMGSWYAAFDAFLLTSANEGAPVVAIEALAAGVPVVATDAGGTRTVVDDGETGFIVDDRRCRCVGGTVAATPRRSGARAGGSARPEPQRMRERFSIERMVDDVERLYAEIVAR